MQIPIINGIYSDGTPDFRTSYPRNMVPVPKQNGIADGYLRPADGISLFGVGPGIDRGSIIWDETHYRVMGSKLISVDDGGSYTVLGDVGGTGQVQMDYSTDRLCIVSGGNAFYWDKTTLTQITDTDLGLVIDVIFIDGYFMFVSADGQYLITTDLANPLSIDPLKYGSSEADPDPINGILKLRNEVYALNRYTIEVFDNKGGDGFPFQRIEGAMVERGALGTNTFALFAETIAFLGSGKKEAPAVYVMTPGGSQAISTREIEAILQQFTEDQLANSLMETRLDKAHQFLLIHLPDRCIVYDAAASLVTKQPVWHVLTSSIVGFSVYRLKNLVWSGGKWIGADPVTFNMGVLNSSLSSHYGQVNGWDFGTQIIYADGNGAIIHELELVALPGRVALGKQPVVWTSYSFDGETWSQERTTNAGGQGRRDKRIMWRKQGKMTNYRMQRFRGTSDCHIAVTRLEAAIEPLYTRPRNG